MIPLTNHDFQWARSELVIIYQHYQSIAPLCTVKEQAEVQWLSSTEWSQDQGHFQMGFSKSLRDCNFGKMGVSENVVYP